MFPFSPRRRGWGCFLFASCQMRGHFKWTLGRAWHIPWSLRDTATGVWLTPKNLNSSTLNSSSNCRVASSLRRQKRRDGCIRNGLHARYGFQEREWGVVILRRNPAEGNPWRMRWHQQRWGGWGRNPKEPEKAWPAGELLARDPQGWTESGEPVRKHVSGKQPWNLLLPEDTSTRWHVCRSRKENKAQNSSHWEEIVCERSEWHWPWPPFSLRLPGWGRGEV